MDDDDNSDDSDPADLTVKYDSKGDKKRKGGRQKCRDNDNIDHTHILYKDPKDDNGDCGYHDDDWYDMEEKEQDNKNDNVIDITTAQFFITPHKTSLIKNNKETEQKKGDESKKNRDGGE